MRRLLTLFGLLALLVSAPLALAAQTTVTESYAALLHQIDTGQVVIAHVNEETDDIRVTLKNGSEQFVRYQHADHKMLIDALIHHGVTPIYTVHKTAAKKPVHHVLRYIAAGVVVVLLLVGAGVWVYTRGQRQPATPPPATDPQPPSVTDPPQTPDAPSA